MDTGIVKKDKRITLLITPDTFMDLQAMKAVKQLSGFSTIIRFAIDRYMSVLKKELSDDQREQFERVRNNFDLTQAYQKAIETDNQE